MKRKELLSPAGDMESLKWAIHAGCDAVYLGGKKFGARKFANNFDKEELIEAIEYCHLYGVKIYVTVNTLMFEEEIEEALDYVTFLHQNGVDAVIMQDIGLIQRVHHLLPNLEIHASTQMHNVNGEGLSLLKELGIKRVVLSRELSLEEVQSFPNDIEKEIFIHGALCISYSGQCLFSSLVLGRSGNRGECAGNCRLKYSLYQDNKKIVEDKYLLSTKELNTSLNFKQIMDSDVTSLKIEGRMKSKYYVYFVTKLYRILMNKYEKNEELVVTKEDIKKLKVLYNRGFTKGYLLGDKLDSLMNIESSKHQGIELGKVIGFNKDKIKIKLSDTLSQGDGIRFSSSLEGMTVNFLYNEKGLLINKASSGDIVYLDNKVGLNKKEDVLKTLDSAFLKEMESFEERKIPIDIKVNAYVNKNLEIIMRDEDDNIVSYQGDIVNEALSCPITQEDIIRNLSKLGNTCFSIQNIIVNMDENIFIRLGTLNEIRRILVEQLVEKRKHKKKEIVIKTQEERNFHSKRIFSTKGISAFVHTEEQLKALLPIANVRIYVENYAWYLTYKETNKVYFRTNRAQSKVIKYHQERLLVGDLGHLFLNKGNNEIVSDFYLNVTNSNTLDYFHSLGISKICLSVELEDDKIQKMIDAYYQKNGFYPNTEILLYGRVELMMMKYCPLKMLLNKENHCHMCKGEEKYYLEDRNYEKYPIVSRACTNYILHYKKINRLNNISKYQKMHIFNYQMIFYDETKEEVVRLVREALSSINFS